MSLPTTGDFNWGVPLDAYINDQVLAVANEALSNISGHVIATDPHGDRAYAGGLVSPITTGVNGPNGFAKCDSTGHLPTSIVPTGAGISKLFDAVKDYGAVDDGVTDNFTKLQSMLTDCKTAGGGECRVFGGTFACGGELVIAAGTRLVLGPGTTIRRITPSGGSAPGRMISNVNFAATPPATPATGNIQITGGMWDAVGPSLTAACTPIFLVKAAFCTVTTTVRNVALNPHIEINGSSFINVQDCIFSGITVSSGFCPAVRLNATSTSTTPSGMASSVYDSTPCSNILLDACEFSLGVHSAASITSMIGSDLVVAGKLHSSVIVRGCTAPTLRGAPVDDSQMSSYSSTGNNFADYDGAFDLATRSTILIGPMTAGPLVAAQVIGTVQYATGTVADATPEAWHNPSLGSGWSNAGGASPICSYQMAPVGSGRRVWIRGRINVGSGNIFTLPAAYIPTYSVSIPVSVIAGVSAAPTLTPRILIRGSLDTSPGAVGAFSIGTATVIEINGDFSLD